MNGVNIKRVKHVREILDDIEEELLPCFTEEDQRLRELCESEMFSDEQIELDQVVGALENSLERIMQCRDSLDFVLNYIDQRGGDTHVS